MWHVCAAPWQNAIISASHRRVNDGAPSSGWRREIGFVSASSAGGLLLLITFYVLWTCLLRNWLSKNVIFQIISGCCTYSHFLSHSDNKRDIWVWQGTMSCGYLWSTYEKIFFFNLHISPLHFLLQHYFLPLLQNSPEFGPFSSLVNSRLSASWHMPVRWNKL